MGDEILLKEIVRQLNYEFGKGCRYLVPTRNPHFVNVYHPELEGQVVSVNIKDKAALFRAFMKANVIVIGGGGIWSRYTGTFAHLIPFVGILGKLFLKKLHFRGIGLYATASKYDRWLVNLAVTLANSCEVRDKESFDQLWNNNKRKAEIAEDLAIPHIRFLGQSQQVPKTIEYDRIASQKKQGKIIIGLSLKPTHDVEINSKIVYEFADAINQLNARFENEILYLLFPFAKTKSELECDDKLIDKIINKLGRVDNIIVMEHGHPISWYQTIKEFADICIAMRYHSVVFAYMAKKPTLCIPYENKIVQFLKERSEWGVKVMQQETIDSSQIIEFVEDKIESITHS